MGVPQMRVRGAAALLATCLAADVGVATFLAVWPMRAAARASGWPHALVGHWPSTLADVAALAWARAAVVGVCALLARSHRPWRLATERTARRACRASLSLLGLKALAVALLAPDDARPVPDSGRLGLTLLGVGVLVGAAGAAADWAACAALHAAWRSARPRSSASSLAGGGAAAPLLGDGGVASEGEGEAKSALDGEPPVGGARTLRVLARIAAADLPHMAVAFTAGSVAALGQSLIPYYTGVALDDATMRPDPAAFHATLARLAAACVATAAFTSVRGGLFYVVGARLNIRTRQRLFDALTAYEPSWFDGVKLGEVTSRLASDTSTISDQLSLSLNVMLRSLTAAAVVLVFMWRASWRLTVLTLAVVPLVSRVTRAYGRFHRRMAAESATALAGANTVAEEILGAVPTVRAHAAQASARAAYAAGLARYGALQATEGRVYALYQLANTGLPALLNAAILGVGGSMVLGGSMSGGALIAFLLYQNTLAGTIQALGDVFASLAAAVGAADKVVALMLREPRLPPCGTLAPPDFAGRVEFSDVRFAYPARPDVPVLRGFCLTVQPGEVVALVGRSGGGKSSVIKLLLRQYVPQAGRVLLDGRGIGDYDPAWLARRVAIVSQEPVLFGRSVRRNILLGLEAEDGVPADRVPSQADVEAAARLANAHDFISALPEGYDTECGDRGVQLSGGQKQRIAIARALVRRPALLLLDEATSALDADSEASVQDAIDRLSSRSRFAMVVVAHRLSTIQNATRIAVVDGGRVVEAGAHDDLIARGGAYASLVRRQMAGGASAASLAGRAPSAG